MSSILKHGDLVKYKTHSPDIGRLGFGINNVYSVVELKDGSIAVQNSHGVQRTLIMPDGELTDASDYFAKHNCPVILPRGIIG